MVGSLQYHERIESTVPPVKKSGLGHGAAYLKQAWGRSNLVSVDLPEKSANCGYNNWTRDTALSNEKEHVVNPWTERK
ncbi:hypothetical protein GLAREA_10448 [Glarea lozoyensis ATCC 20868]|uniref:Uncharacterized protein n=1 Tax=Glarea lozoyensis (strain ATCC 20868 / MF5171) TaxID=1116229 RepID=S3DCE6_GLAL2|nr:uncharacterized protein GLAREA_10448 [Glarea lozoyensis ATCC 20868]EPE34754.1 hypothetical protein GLAREA_10448 [Glarea lozoyensis ATCC 20868]